jgi:UPF0176 protein
MVLLDTRNDYEVKIGTFKGARDLKLGHFRNFPESLSRLQTEIRGTEIPIVTFCTGGIRCEKAGAHMVKEGWQNVYQLDGGILNYFEKCGNSHFEGECFVFDQRVAVEVSSQGQIQQASTVQCFACRSPLNSEEQKSPLYRPFHSCPNCSLTPASAH